MSKFKKIIKKSYVQLLILCLLFLTILLWVYAKPVVKNVYYSAEVNGGSYKTNVVRFQLHNNGEMKGFYIYGGDTFEYTYILSGNYIYLYKESSNNKVEFFQRLTIKDKFRIVDQQGKIYRAKDSEIGFYILIGINCLLGVLTITFLVLDLRKNKKQKSKQIQNKTQEEE